MTGPGVLAVLHDRVRHVDGAFKGQQATVIEVVIDPARLTALLPKAVGVGCAAGYCIRFDEEQVWAEAHPSIRAYPCRTWFVPAEQWRKVEAGAAVPEPRKAAPPNRAARRKQAKDKGVSDGL